MSSAITCFVARIVVSLTWLLHCASAPWLCSLSPKSCTAMAVIIEKVVYVSLGGKRSWRIKRPLDVEGILFVKFEPCDNHLVRLVCEDVLPMCELRKNASLTHCRGLKELIKVRNDAARDRFQQENTTCELFAASSITRAKRVKRSASTVKEMRIHREVVEVTLPSYGEHAPLPVRMLAPVSPRDDLTVELSTEALEYVFGYIKHYGISGDEINNKRGYKVEPLPAGIWKTKRGFTVRLPSKKYRRAKTMEEAVAISEIDVGSVNQQKASASGACDVDLGE